MWSWLEHIVVAIVLALGPGDRERARPAASEAAAPVAADNPCRLYLDARARSNCIERRSRPPQVAEAVPSTTIWVRPADPGMPDPVRFHREFR